MRKFYKVITESNHILCIIQITGATYKGNYKTDNAEWKYIEDIGNYSTTYIKTGFSETSKVMKVIVIELKQKDLIL